MYWALPTELIRLFMLSNVVCCNHLLHAHEVGHEQVHNLLRVLLLCLVLPVRPKTVHLGPSNEQPFRVVCLEKHA